MKIAAVLTNENVDRVVTDESLPIIFSVIEDMPPQSCAMLPQG